MKIDFNRSERNSMSSNHSCYVGGQIRRAEDRINEHHVYADRDFLPASYIIPICLA